MVRFYSDAGAQKELILKENRGKSGIYRWTNKETGKSYVGSAVDISKRFTTYYSQYMIKEVLIRSKSLILSAIQKHGHSKFSLTIIEYCDPSDLIRREQYYIDLLKPEYNICQTAGSSLGRILSEETKMKISNYFKGRPISEVAKQKMSESRTGKKFTEETKKKLSELQKGKPGPFLGKQHSEETKQKMSEAIGSKVEVLNIETNETTIYSSNFQAAKVLDCSD